MGGTPSPPPPINTNPNDPNSVPNVDTGYRTTAGINSQQGTAIGQNNPYGSLSYSTSINPTTGLPQLTANQNFSPLQQAIFALQQGGQIGQGGTALAAIANMFGQYTQQPDLINKAQDIVNANTSPMNASWERFMAPQRDQLRTQLINQGLTEGSPAYQQQMDMLTNQQQLTKGSWLAQFQPQAYQEAMGNYELPLQNVQRMLSGVAPGSIMQNLYGTPALSISPTDFSGQSIEAQQEAFRNYQQQVAAQNNLMNGIFGGIGSVAKLPTGGGGSIGGDIFSEMMFL